MTEQEWLECADSQKMLEFLRGKASDRKLRLFACACAQNIWRFYPGERSRHVVAVSERYADGLATKDELKMARKRSSHCEASTSRALAFQAAIETARSAAYDLRLLAIDMSAERAIIEGYSTRTPAGLRLETEEEGHQSEFLRDIFGNPFRPLSFNPSWRTSTVNQIADAIYQEKAFDRLPILADALEDAGCDCTELLTHLRRPAEHVRGCWAIDLILGKE